MILENESERLTARHTAIFIDEDSDLLLYPRCETCGNFLYLLCFMGIWFFYCGQCHESHGYIIQKN